MITSRRVAGVERRALATLALAGASLAVGQFLLVREFVSLLYGEELVIVAVSACFFLGLSVGYGVAARLQPARLQAALALCVGAQLLFPAATRVGAAWMSELAYAGGWLFLWLFGHAIVFAAAPAALLPALLDRRRLVDGSPAARVARLRSSYTAELLGYLAGLALVAACFHRPPATLLALYWSLLVALAWIVGARRRWIAALAVVAAVMTAWLPRLLTATSETVYAFKHGLDGARLRMSIDSPYQRVEVVERPGRGRALYLDGLQNLNASDLGALNHYLSVVPATLLRPARALIIGNGTLSAVEALARRSGHLTSVELDPGVVLAGARFFVDPRRLAKLANWSLHVEDGKQFLARAEQRFDLIIVDVPSPLTLQEGFLHTREFYAQAHARLAAGGVLSVQLSGPLRANDRTPARIVASLRAVFPYVIVVESARADRSFAYAAERAPFTKASLEEVALVDDRIVVLEPAAVDRRVQAARPLTLDALDVVVRRGLERIVGRYFAAEGD